jgi:hypothetical protein
MPDLHYRINDGAAVDLQRFSLYKRMEPRQSRLSIWANRQVRQT